MVTCRYKDILVGNLNTWQISNQLENVRKTYLIFYLILIGPVKEKSLRVSPQNNWSDNSRVLEIKKKHEY